MRGLLGDAYEDARLELKNPDGQPSKTRGKPASKGKRKKADDDDDDDDAKPASKRTRPQRAKKEKDDDATSIGTPQLLLANKWDLDKGADPTGWWVSEKLDGVR